MSVRRRQLALAVPLAAAVVLSGVWAINTKHRARQLFVELEALNRERDRLQVDWGRLQLEHSTWGTHARIESLAVERLNLSAPPADEVVVVVEPGR